MKNKYFAVLAIASLLSMGSVGFWRLHIAQANPFSTAQNAQNKVWHTAQAKSAPLIYTDPQAKDNLAIRGYDTVAYFKQGKPVKGSSNYKIKWQGAIWQFSSAENLALFKQNPSNYAPQYGGYCAKAVSEGYLASIVPEAWKIVGGKLYLNYSAAVQQEWLQDVPGKVAKADQNWPKVLKTSGVIYYDTVGTVRY